MESLFCSKCGTKIFYSGKTPEKCSGCGKPLGQSFATPIAKQPEPQEGVVPTVSQVQIDIEIDTVKPMTLKDHWLSASQNEERYTRETPDLPSNMLEQTIKDCQPNKQSKDVGE